MTIKDSPGDFDMIWDMEGVKLESLDPVFSDLDPPRVGQQVKYGGDILPNVVERSTNMPFLEFFQQDSLTGRRRGIVQLTPEVIL